MKKLMIAAAIVCAAAMSQAATWNWTSDGTLVDGAGAISQSLNGGSAVLMYLGNGAAADWSLASDANVRDTGTFTYDPGVFIPGVGQIVPESNSISGGYNLVSGTDVNDYWYGVMFKDAEGKYSRFTATDGSPLLTDAVQLKGFDNPTSTPQGFTFVSGNYMTQAVPEPTSGLLLLLGVAGLALRRRRA